MDKISPEEKIQWMKKILQKKESIRKRSFSCLCRRGLRYASGIL